MKKLCFITIILIVHSFSGISQGKNDAIQEIGLSTIAWANQGNSYITFPTDIGNIEPLWFEGNLIPNFYLRVNKDSRLMGVITPQVIIRMYQEESFPVRTPSYIPQMNMYYLLSPKSQVNSLSIFGKFAHHSNGQDGEFRLDNGDINLKDGNFATNYFELGFIRTNYNSNYNAVQFFSSSMQIHPPRLTEEELSEIYSMYRWNSTISIFKIPQNSSVNNKKKASISIKAQSTWMFGNVNNWNTFSLDRLNLSLTFYYHPKFLEDIGFFTQIYHGMDYYNIYFNHKINVIRFGIMTEKLRF